MDDQGYLYLAGAGVGRLSNSSNILPPYPLSPLFPELTFKSIATSRYIKNYKNYYNNIILL